MEVVRRFWGFDALRPPQAEDITTSLAQRDSLVVMPTGSAKFLFYQAPPVIAGQPDAVVSSLISLKKEQVDALRTCGYPAASLHSEMNVSVRRQVEVGRRADRIG